MVSHKIVSFLRFVDTIRDNTVSNKKIKPLNYTKLQFIKVYIDLGTTSGPVTLNVLTMGNRNRAFDIRVSQIHCASTYRG